MAPGHAESRELTMGSPSGLEKSFDRPESWAARLDHDVRHELGTISMLAAAARTDSCVTPDLSQILLRIEEEARQLALLVSHSLGRQPATQVTGVRAIVDELVAAFRLVRTTSLDVVGAERHVLADPVALRRAARNLVDNAVRAAGPCGRVLVEVIDEGSWVVLAVLDDGAAIHPQEHPAAVRPHHCLGLDVVTEFTERSGGQFIVSRSRLGGTSAAIRLRHSRTLPNGLPS